MMASPTTSASKTSRRAETLVTVGSSRSIWRRARRASGQVVRTRIAVAARATKSAPIGDSPFARIGTSTVASHRPTSAAGTVTSSPSTSCAQRSWPPDAPRPRARTMAARRRRTMRMAMSPSAPAATASGPRAATARAASAVARSLR